MKNKEIFVPKPNENFPHYLYWICERMNIFWKKYNGDPQPWTADPICKITNLLRCIVALTV